MPDWILTVPRLIWTPVRWIGRRIRRYAVNCQNLVREGSNAITPVIQFTKRLGPTSVMWGTQDENRATLQNRYTEWAGLRDRLMTYVKRQGFGELSDRQKKQRLAKI